MTTRAHLEKLVDEGGVRLRHARPDEIFESVS